MLMIVARSCCRYLLTKAKYCFYSTHTGECSRFWNDGRWTANVAMAGPDWPFENQGLCRDDGGQNLPRGCPTSRQNFRCRGPQAKHGRSKISRREQTQQRILLHHQKGFLSWQGLRICQRQNAPGLLDCHPPSPDFLSIWIKNPEFLIKIFDFFKIDGQKFEFSLFYWNPWA